MGVGTPANILEAVERGVDFFDCVYPSRNGRHGHVYTNQGKLNLFNAKYYKTDRSLILDLCQPAKAKESFSAGFVWISLVIVLGQILIVTFAGKMFNVEMLSLGDWWRIILITSPVLLVADIFRTVRAMMK